MNEWNIMFVIYEHKTTHTIFPPREGNKQLVSPVFHANWQSVFGYESSGGFGPFLQFLIRVREVNLRPFEHFLENVSARNKCREAQREDDSERRVHISPLFSNRLFS